MSNQNETFIGTTPEGDFVYRSPFLYGWLLFKFGSTKNQNADFYDFAFMSYHRGTLQISRLEGHLFKRSFMVSFSRRRAFGLEP